MGVPDSEAILLMQASPRQVIFTANSDTPYACGVADLHDTGPLVIDMPEGPFIGLADDHHQRWIVDMGLPGPDAGKGGRYLLLPPGYKEKAPAGYHAAHAFTLKVLLAFRAMPIGGDFDAALRALRRIQVYPLSQGPEGPRTMKFMDVTGRPSDATCLRWEDNLQYWQKLHEILIFEPPVKEFRPMYGALASLGIEKEKPFQPDDRMKQILEDAARQGRDQMLEEAFCSTRSDIEVFGDRRWEWVGLVPQNGNFESPSYLDTAARDRWFIQAIVSSPAMFRRQVGSGSTYFLSAWDRDGAFLDGDKTYRLRVPQPVPASLFWSVTAYDAETRSQVQTDLDKAALRSLAGEFRPDPEDGSVQLFFGPTAPEGLEGQWIKTVPGKGWFAYFRIYGPTGKAFDGSWKPGDFEEVK
jgi:hypothetical protein